METPSASSIRIVDGDEDKPNTVACAPRACLADDDRTADMDHIDRKQSRLQSATPAVGYGLPVHMSQPLRGQPRADAGRVSGLCRAREQLWWK